MKFDDVSFPHPVLGIGDAISGKTGFRNEPEISTIQDSYQITIECNLVNDDLQSLVKAVKAEFVCEATCSNTIYRENVVSNNSTIEIEIPKKQVKGKVEFTCLLVAKENLLSYSNSKAHSDYNNFTFDLDKGDVLAFFGEFAFDADIKYEKLKAVSSFMEVVENESITFTNIDLKKPKIEVQLSSNDYNSYKNETIAHEIKFSPMFHSSLVLNALLVALYNFDEHKNYLWAKALNIQIGK